MATEVGWASLGIVPTFDKFGSQLDRGTSAAMLTAGNRGGATFGNAAGKTAGQRFGSVFKTAAQASLVGVGALAVGAFKVGKDSIESASALGESVNAVNVAYGKQGKYVQGLANSAAKLNGVSNREYNEFAVRFASFSQTIAGSKGFESVRVLDQIGDRATDFASVFNTDVNEALTLFQSGLAGETEPLRRYGIDLSAAAVESYALSEGIVKNKDDLDESAKVQARFQLLMEKTSNTQGDFANTSDSLANRQRILTARWEDAKAKLGAGLLPIVEDFTGFLLNEGIPAIEDFSDWFNDEGVDGLRTFGDFTKDEVLPVLEDVGDFAKTAAGHARDLVEFLNDLPKPAKYAGLITLLGGLGALKLRGGGPGRLGSVGSALGLAKPVPVFVTNPGFGGPGTPGGKTPIPWLAGLSLPFIAGAGGAAAASVTSDDNRNSLAPGSGGFAGDGGMTLPPGTTIDELGNLFGDTEKAADDFFATSSSGFDDLISGGIDPATSSTRKLKEKIDELPTSKRMRLELSGYEDAYGNVVALLSLFDDRVISREVRASDPTAPAAAPRTGTTVPRTGVNVNVGSVNVNSKSAVESWALKSGQQAALGGWG